MRWERHVVEMPSTKGIVGILIWLEKRENPCGVSKRESQRVHANSRAKSFYSDVMLQDP